MPGKSRHPVLHLIASGTKAAPELEPFIKACQKLDWEVCVIPTPDATGWINKTALADLTGHPVRETEPSRKARPLPTADAYAAAPASFDLVNRWAYGFNDCLALRLLTEATAVGLPVVVIPAPGPALARHPVFAENLERLRQWGISVPVGPARPPMSAAGDDEAPDGMPWQAAEQVIAAWTRFARIPAENRRPDPAEVELPAPTR